MHHTAVRPKEIIRKIFHVFMMFPTREFHQSIYSLTMLWLNDLQFEISESLKTL